MTIAIVAIPNENGDVHKISTEKKAHMTLLFLGENNGTVDLEGLASYTKHVADTFTSGLYMEVEKRGVLGDDKADVLFFKKKSGAYPQALALRHYLLQDSQIRRLYDSVEQYPEWIPHLTLGYPENPARELEYPINFVSFDRLALWYDDSEGPEFEFMDGGNVVDDVIYSDKELLDDILIHYGVKGMKWGRRKSQSSSGGSGEGAISRLKKQIQGPDGPEDVTVTTRPGQKVKTSGGRKREASADAISAAKIRQVAKKSTTDSLSNDELQTLVTRMNLEQQYKNLSEKNMSSGRKLVKSVMGEGDKIMDQEARKATRKVAARVALKFATGV